MTEMAQRTVGEIAAEHPLATRVFARHGIDYCCGGGRPLEEVCRAKNLAPDRLLDEIKKEIGTASTSEVRWDQRSVRTLIAHVLEHFHAPLKEELLRLESMAAKVHRVHGEKDASLELILSTVEALRRDLEKHMMKEERVLFPMILNGQGRLAGGPVSVMEEEHETAGELLRRLRKLTNDYQVPDAACASWRALWAGLEVLERDLHEHIHLENNIGRFLPPPVTEMAPEIAWDEHDQCQPDRRVDHHQ